MNQLQKEEFKILQYFDDFTKEHNLRYFLYAGSLLGAVRHKGFIPWDDDIDVAMKRSEFEKFEKLFIDSDYLENGYTFQSRKIFKYQALPFSKIRSNSYNVIERMPSTQKGNYGPWLDIFPFDNIPDDYDLRVEQYKKVTFYNNLIKKFLMIQVEPNDKGIKRLLKRIIQWSNETLHPLYFFLPYIFKKRHYYMTMYNNIETTHSADISYIHYKDFEDFSKGFFSNKYLNDLIEIEFEGSYFSAPKEFDEILKIQYGDYMTLPQESERKIHKIEQA